MADNPLASIPAAELLAKGLAQALGVSLAITGPDGALLVLATGNGHGVGKVHDSRAAGVPSWVAEAPAAPLKLPSGITASLRLRANGGKIDVAAISLFLESQIAALEKGRLDVDGMAAQLLDAYEEINLFYELADIFEDAEDEKQLGGILLQKALEAGTGQGGAVILAHDGRQEEPPVPITAGETGAALLSGTVEGLPAIKTAFERGLACNVSPETQDGREFDRPTIVTPILIKRVPAGALVIQKRGSPFDSGEMKHVQALAAEAGVFLNNLRQTRRLIDAAQLKKQVELAETIQRQLLPSTELRVKGLDMAGTYLATNQVGGDYYDIIESADRVTALVADVSGHSIPSSLIMTSARTAVHLLTQTESRPAEILRKLNENLYHDLDQTGLFLSMFLVTLDPATGAARYASAGHNPPFLYLRATGNILKLDATGLLTGVSATASYSEVPIKLGPGDVLVLYTDGVTEARGRGDDFFGEDRLEKLVTQHAGGTAKEMVVAILAEVERYAGKRLADDITLLIVKVPDEPAP